MSAPSLGKSGRAKGRRRGRGDAPADCRSCSCGGPHGALRRVAPLNAIALTTLPGVERHPSLSPDGNQVAFAWDGLQQGNPDIYVQQVDSGSPLRLTTDTLNDHSPAWSPDGRWIAFLRGPRENGTHELRIIPPLGGPDRKLRDIHPRGEVLRLASLAWCADSRCLVVTDSTGAGKPDALFVVSFESGETRQLTFPPPAALSDSDQAISPDGNRLVFRRNLTPTNGDLYTLPLKEASTAAGDAIHLATNGLNADYPTWMPDSREFCFPPGAACGGSRLLARALRHRCRLSALTVRCRSCRGRSLIDRPASSTCAVSPTTTSGGLRRAELGLRPHRLRPQRLPRPRSTARRSFLRTAAASRLRRIDQGNWRSG